MAVRKYDVEVIKNEYSQGKWETFSDFCKDKYGENWKTAYSTLRNKGVTKSQLEEARHKYINTIHAKTACAIADSHASINRKYFDFVVRLLDKLEKKFDGQLSVHEIKSISGTLREFRDLQLAAKNNEIFEEGAQRQMVLITMTHFWDWFAKQLEASDDIFKQKIERVMDRFVNSI